MGRGEREGKGVREGQGMEDGKAEDKERKVRKRGEDGCRVTMKLRELGK